MPSFPGFTMPEELRLLGEQIRRFVQEEIIPLERQIDPDAPDLPDEDFARLSAKTKAAGLWALGAPEQYGGGGLDTINSAITNSGTLTLRHSVASGNQAVRANNTNGFGGAIYSGSNAANPATVGLDELKPLVRPFGVCLIECAGNTNPSNFGLLSAAEWGGVPLTAVLDRMQPKKSAARVLVSGVDDFTRPSQTSVPGASWLRKRMLASVPRTITSWLPRLAP